VDEEDGREFEDDAALEEKIRQAVAHFDPLPPEALQRAVEGFAWRNVDEELAELVLDSLMDPRDAALVRAGEESRALTFRADGLSIEVRIARTLARSSFDIVGQLVPPQEAVVEVRHRDGAVELEADELGCFAARGVRAGPFSLRCGGLGSEGGGHVVTEWVLL
jgi:hypothetical protein